MQVFLFLSFSFFLLHFLSFPFFPAPPLPPSSHSHPLIDRMQKFVLLAALFVAAVLCAPTPPSFGAYTLNILFPLLSLSHSCYSIMLHYIPLSHFYINLSHYDHITHNSQFPFLSALPHSLTAHIPSPFLLSSLTILSPFFVNQNFLLIGGNFHVELEGN